MNSILNDSCKELIRKIGIAKKSLSDKTFPSEVMPCLTWVLDSLDSFSKELYRIEGYLRRNLKDKILDQTWYNELASINNELEVLDAYFIHPLYRLSEKDLLALKLIDWLHKSHDITKSKPFILSNGSFSIAPSENAPTLYWLPVTSQLSLLHYPLFFHEFGHQLFLYHKSEMEDLISEFQNKLASHLQPAVSQSDEKYQSYIEKAAEIVETWREWMEELFCDAVGLMIGGKSYLLAFSHFIRLGGLKEFFVPEKYLAKRSHPVSLLRIGFLAERARNLGLSNEADFLENEWNEIASTLGVNEDYFGYYEETYRSEIVSLLDDMLVEANPMLFNNEAFSVELEAPVNYLNIIQQAWEHFLADSLSYDAWEQSLTEKILQRV